MNKIIEVISCSDVFSWYDAYVGTKTRFFVSREEFDRYWVRDEEGYLNFVLKKDAKEV